MRKILKVFRRYFQSTFCEICTLSK